MTFSKLDACQATTKFKRHAPGGDNRSMGRENIFGQCGRTSLLSRKLHNLKYRRDITLTLYTLRLVDESWKFPNAIVSLEGLAWIVELKRSDGRYSGYSSTEDRAC